MLTTRQSELFRTRGYLLVEGVLDPESDLDPVIAEYEVLLDRLVRQLYDEGKISSLHEGLDFPSRLTEIYHETGETFTQYFDISLPMTNVRPDTPFWTGPAIFNLIRNPALVDLVESILGPEIASNPIQHTRIKPPSQLIGSDMQEGGLVGQTPWHQDAAVIPPDVDTEMITVWVPVTEASREAGCLQFLPNLVSDGLIRHGFGKVDGVEIPADAIVGVEPVAVPAKRGDVLLIHRYCPHASLTNVSGQVRFSLDLRYHPSHQTSGREMFPSFIVRSRSDPGQELTDAAAWTEMWEEARTWLATSPDAPRETYPWLR